MDNFEKQIRENKSLFDEHKADKDKLWANIESELNKVESKPKVIKLWSSNVLKFAAILVIALGLFSVVNILSSNVATQESNVISQELNDIDAHYKGMVAYQVKLVKNNTQLSDEQKTEFLSFMDELDEEYKALKLELSKNLDNERILEALVFNYKKRIELIENLLKQINSSKKTNNTDVYTL
jgi:hypothetical protein